MKCNDCFRNGPYFKVVRRLRMAKPVSKKHRLAISNLEDEEDAVTQPIQMIPISYNQPYSINVSGNARVHLGDQIYSGASSSCGTTSSAFGIDTRRRRHVDSGHEVSDGDTFVKLLKSLTFSRMNDRVRSITPAQIRTCEWFFKHECYSSWLDDSRIEQHGGFLWIKGKPGSGKSTLIKLVLDNFKIKHKDHICVSYFFNARAPEELEKSVLGLYRSLVHQLVSNIPFLQEYFLSTFGLKTNSDLGTDEWSEHELQSFLTEIITWPHVIPHPLQLCIFVDALDEGNEGNIRQLLEFLEDLTQRTIETESQHTVRICLSSRHYPHVTIRRGLSVILERQPEHENDIERYIQNRLKIEDELSHNALAIQIRQKAQNVFLWVVLVVRTLNRMHDQGFTVQQLISHVQTISNELAGLYDDVLLRVSGDQSTTVFLLQWVLFARQRLNTMEVYEILQNRTGSTMATQVDNPPASTQQSFLLHHSRGLVEIVHLDDENYVQFVHETVRDFLLGSGGLVLLDHNLSSNLIGLSHEALKLRCIKEVESPEIDIDHFDSLKRPAKRLLLRKLHKRYPFLRYASRRLFKHMNEAQVAGICQRQLLIDINQPSSKIFHNWSRLFFDGAYAPSERADKPLSLIHMLLTDSDGSNRFNNLIDLLLDIGVDVNAGGGRCGTMYRSPLQTAVTRANARSVRGLINAGADIHAFGGTDDNILMAAVTRRNDEIFELVKSCKAPSSQETLQVKLSACIQRQMYSRVLFLLARGADVNVVIPW